MSPVHPAQPELISSDDEDDSDEDEDERVFVDGVCISLHDHEDGQEQ